MTEHVLECRWESQRCVCEELRACEQRVLAEREADGPWFRSVVHDCCVDKQTAYAAGLDAAREAVADIFERDYAARKAVADVLERDYRMDVYLAMYDYLAAIDALREKQK